MVMECPGLKDRCFEIVTRAFHNTLSNAQIASFLPRDNIAYFIFV